MRKLFVLSVFIAAASLPAYAQGFYFDIGLGAGGGTVKIDGDKVSDKIKGDETAASFGLKAGYGPLANTKLYIAGEFSGMGYRIDKPEVLTDAITANYPAKMDFVQYNLYLLGGGLIFYPVPLLQFGLSIGYSYGMIIANSAQSTLHTSKDGFACHASAAVDLGGKKHALLIGLDYFYAQNVLENGTSNGKEEAAVFGLFVKYAYRTKVSPSSPGAS